MKKALMLLIMGLFIGSFAYADLIPNGSVPQKQKLSAQNEQLSVDPTTIISEVTAAANRLGVREGVFYNFNKREITNYAAATIYTLPQFPLAIDFGAINTDGVALTVDYNIGSAIPAGNDALTGLLQYLYVGGGVDARYVDKNSVDPTKTWQVGVGLDAQFKGTF